MFINNRKNEIQKEYNLNSYCKPNIDIYHIECEGNILTGSGNLENPENEYDEW